MHHAGLGHLHFVSKQIDLNWQNPDLRDAHESQMNFRSNRRFRMGRYDCQCANFAIKSHRRLRNESSDSAEPRFTSRRSFRSASPDTLTRSDMAVIFSGLHSPRLCGTATTSMPGTTETASAKRRWRPRAEQFILSKLMTPAARSFRGYWSVPS